MAWFLFLLALASLALVFFTNALVPGVCGMLASLIFTALGTMTMLVVRSDGSQRSS